MDTIKIGKFLAENRKKKKMTQEKLAEKMGVTAKTISRWENGNYMPDISLLKPLSQELGITLNDLISGEKVEEENYHTKTEENIDLILREYYQMKKQRKIFKIAFIVIGTVAFALMLQLILRFGLGSALCLIREKEVVTDISRYETVIGKKAKGNFADKWGIEESIFPETLEKGSVQDFKAIYNNSWDSEFVSYLVMQYSKEEYEKEMERLTQIGIEPYVGKYGVEGFSQYTLVAIEVDDYYGFVYAITDGKGTIIYVELIFCNYILDIPYEKEVPQEYLPNGFQAKADNPYRKEQLKKEGGEKPIDLLENL